MTNTFDRVDGTANIRQQFNVSCVSNDFGQQRYTETRRGCVVAPQKDKTLTNIFATFYVTSRLHEQFFTCANFYLPDFQQMNLSHKIWANFVI